MSEPWTLLRLLKWTTGFFKEKEIDNARLDAELLIAKVLELDRVGLYLNYDRPLSADELARIRPLVKRRGQREPLQYLLGNTEFWSLEFKVTPDVLVPRADTEVLVEEALSKASETGELLDIGTGSGAIALSFASEKPGWRVTGVDISDAALNVAKENAAALKLETRSQWHIADLAALPDKDYSLVVSNPPYISEVEYSRLMPEVREHEPRVALLAGENGIACYRQIVSQASRIIRPGGWLLFEIGYQQELAVSELFAAAGLVDIYSRKDYAGNPRIVGGRRADG